MRRARRLAIPVLAGALSAGAAAGPAPEGTRIPTADAPPPGFEAFFQRQETLLDVYYAGRFLGTARASYDIDSLRFDDPAALVAAIEDLREPASVLEALSGDLDTHAGLLCGRRRDDCGRLEPEVAGVIFDASRFRADLFVASDQLETRGPDIDRFLPGSDARFSALQNLSANYSGASDGGRDAWNVISVTSASWAETHLQMESTWNDVDAFTLDAVSVRREFRGRMSQAGVFRTNGQSLGFVRDRDLLGVRFGSSLQTRLDRAFADGSPLAVFLPERARVEIFQDGRLLASGAYEAGNRILDTSSLPEGAYEVELRIREIGGTERVERRFFVKTTRIPPMDQPLWSVELGRVVDRNADGALPGDADAWFGRASFSRRVTDQLGLNATAVTNGEDGILEAGIFRIDRFAEVQASAFVGTEREHGAAGFARLFAGRVNLVLDWRVVRADDTFTPEALVSGDLDQVGLNFSTLFAGGRLGLVARYDARGGAASTASQGLTWERFVSRGSNSFLRYFVDVSRQEDDWVALTGIQFDMRGARTNARLEPSLRLDREADGRDDLGLQNRARLAWEDARARRRTTRLGMTGISGPRENRIGADGLHEGRFGVVDGQIDRDFEQDDRTTWTAMLNTSLLTDGDSLSLGGRDRTRAAALIAIDGNVPDARFEVLVDGFPQGIARAGTTTPVHLQPWRSYTVRLRPIGEALLSWDNREHDITLYPGNVVRLEWQVAEVIVLLGRIVDADGAAVEGARLDGAVGLAVSEPGGYFQAEVERPEPGERIELVARRSDARDCRIAVELDGVEGRRGIYRVGTRDCE